MEDVKPPEGTKDNTLPQSEQKALTIHMTCVVLVMSEQELYDFLILRELDAPITADELEAAGEQS